MCKHLFLYFFDDELSYKIKNDLNDNLNKIFKLSNENKELKEELINKDELLDVAEKKINKLELEMFSLEDKLRQWRLRFKKLVNYLKNKVFGLFDNKNQDIYFIKNMLQLNYRKELDLWINLNI